MDVPTSTPQPRPSSVRPPDRRRTRPPRTAKLVLLVGAAVVAMALTGCSDDADSAETMPLGEWVAEFDEVCAQVIADTEADPDDFEAISDAGIAELRALPEPDEKADTAAFLLDTIGTDADEDLGQAEIDALDEELFAAFTELGVSEACIQGVPG